MSQRQFPPDPAENDDQVLSAEELDDASEEAKHGGRGRGAAQPFAIPLSGWKDIIIRLYQRASRDNVTLIAAGVAFYFLLSLFPALAAIASVWGFISDPADLEQVFGLLQDTLPENAAEISNTIIARFNANSQTELSIAFAISLLTSLWTARLGLASLITACNVAYGEDNARGIIGGVVFALVSTLVTIVFFILCLSVILLNQLVTGSWLAGTPLAGMDGLVSWLLIIFFCFVWLAFVYRYAPTRREPRWSWVSWGAAVAVAVWAGASYLFSLYVEQFGQFDRVYGTLGGVVILLFWFWLSALIAIMGAQINAETEHQTALDTTVGEDRPMGERGAWVADTLGKSKGGDS